MQSIGRVGEVNHPETEVEGDEDHRVVHELKKESGLAPKENLLSDGRVLPGMRASLSLLVIEEIEVLLQSLGDLHRLPADYIRGLSNLPHPLQQILIMIHFKNSSAHYAYAKLLCYGMSVLSWCSLFNLRCMRLFRDILVVAVEQVASVIRTHSMHAVNREVVITSCNR